MSSYFFFRPFIPFRLDRKKKDDIGKWNQTGTQFSRANRPRLLLHTAICTLSYSFTRSQKYPKVKAWCSRHVHDHHHCPYAQEINQRSFDSHNMYCIQAHREGSTIDWLLVVTLSIFNYAHYHHSPHTSMPCNVLKTSYSSSSSPSSSINSPSIFNILLNK